MHAFIPTICWYTDVLYNEGEERHQALRHLINKNGDAFDYCGDNLGLPSMELFRQMRTSNLIETSVVSQILRYRALDIAELLDSEHLPTRIEKKGRHFQQPRTQPPWWKQLTKDWTRLPANALLLLQHHFPASAKNVAAERLTDDIATLVMDSCKAEFLVNLILAAQYLALLLAGQEYPDRADEFRAYIRGDQNTAIFEELETANTARVVLQIALAISPLALLSLFALHKTPITRLVMYDILQGLGGPRPPSVVECEKRMWHLLKRMGTSRVSVEEIIAQLQAMSEKLETVPELERSWFGRTLEEGQLQDDSMEVDDVSLGFVSHRLQIRLNDGGEGLLSDGHYQIKQECQAGQLKEVIDLTVEPFIPSAPILEDVIYDQDNEGRQDERLWLYQHHDQPLEFVPVFHHMPQLTTLVNLYNAVEARYTELDLPLHVGCDPQSLFKTMNYTEFMRDKDKIQDLLNDYNIVVYDMPTDEMPVQFDEDGLNLLCDPFRRLTVHDYSVFVNGDENARARNACTTDLLESHRHRKGKSLNALDFPMQDIDPPDPSVASDIVAFNAFEGDISQFPETHVRWGLACTSGVITSYHNDANAFATYLDVRNEDGGKWWVVASNGATPEHDIKAISSPSRVCDGIFEHNFKKVEGIYLTSGMRLYMRPGQSHSVWTPTSTICTGGHYLSKGTIRRSCVGFLVDFLVNKSISNAEHSLEFQQLLRQLVKYWHSVYIAGHWKKSGPWGGSDPHVPSIDREGILSIFSACNLLELANITEHRSYKDPGIPGMKRFAMMEGRRYAREIIAWLVSNYHLKPKEGDQPQPTPLLSIYWSYLSKQAAALSTARPLLHQKQYIKKGGLVSAPRMEQLIMDSFERDLVQFWAYYDTYRMDEVNDVDFDIPSFVHRELERSVVEPLIEPDFVSIPWDMTGVNGDDVLFMASGDAHPTPAKRQKITK